MQYSPRTNFGEAHRGQVLNGRNVITLLHANLVGMELAADPARIEVIRAKSLSGSSFVIRPKAVILAAGGIENARLLLTLNYDRPAGLGNECNLAGRIFMEHLHVPVGHLATARGVAKRKSYLRNANTEADAAAVIIPTAAARKRHRLLAASIAIEPASYSFGKHYLAWPTPFIYGPFE